MLTTIEAEIDLDGNVTLLEPLRLKRKSRALVTLLESDAVRIKPLSDEEIRLAEERFARWIGEPHEEIGIARAQHGEDQGRRKIDRYRSPNDRSRPSCASTARPASSAARRLRRGSIESRRRLGQSPLFLRGATQQN